MCYHIWSSPSCFIGWSRLGTDTLHTATGWKIIVIEKEYIFNDKMPISLIDLDISGRASIHFSQVWKRRRGPRCQYIQITTLATILVIILYCSLLNVNCKSSFTIFNDTFDKMTYHICIYIIELNCVFKKYFASIYH